MRCIVDHQDFEPNWRYYLFYQLSKFLLNKYITLFVILFLHTPSMSLVCNLGSVNWRSKISSIWLFESILRWALFCWRKKTKWFVGVSHLKVHGSNGNRGGGNNGQ